MGPIVGRIKQCKCRVILREFPHNNALFGFDLCWKGESWEILPCGKGGPKKRVDMGKKMTPLKFNIEPENGPLGKADRRSLLDRNYHFWWSMINFGGALICVREKFAKSTNLRAFLLSLKKNERLDSIIHCKGIPKRVKGFLVTSIAGETFESTQYQINSDVMLFKFV